VHAVNAGKTQAIAPCCHGQPRKREC
jgi:hypothetical protein